MSVLTVGSLFAGIGGIELGLERTGGFRSVWQVEKDAFARRVLEKHWPGVRRWDDVRTFPPEPWEDWGCDLICGGFPCQDISQAGRRAGIAGARSGLWSGFARTVRALRPRYVLVENVSALLVRGLDVVLGDLAACGYDAEWQVLSAQAAGAPHLRERVFLVAYPRDALRQGWSASLADPGVFRGESRPSPGGRSGRLAGGGSVPDSDGERRQNRGVRYVPPGEPRGSDQHRSEFPGIGDRSAWWEVEPGVGRVAHGVPDRVDRLRCLGNAVVPQCAEYVGRLILAHHRGGG